MAFKQQDNTYITVEHVSETGVFIRVHANVAHRGRYKNGTETGFETTRGESRDVPVDLTTNADASKSIKDNITSAGYTALKTLEEFAGSEDV